MRDRVGSGDTSGVSTRNDESRHGLHGRAITLLFVLALAGGLFLLITGDTSARVAGFLFVVIAAGRLLDDRRSV